MSLLKEMKNNVINIISRKICTYYTIYLSSEEVAILLSFKHNIFLILFVLFYSVCCFRGVKVNGIKFVFAPEISASSFNCIIVNTILGLLLIEAIFSISKCPILLLFYHLNLIVIEFHLFAIRN